MNGCKNKSSFFESKGARGGNQAAGLGMDKIWVRRDRERPFQNRHGKAISIMWAKHGGRNLLGVSMERCMMRSKDLVAKRRRTACYVSWER